MNLSARRLLVSVLALIALLGVVLMAMQLGRGDGASVEEVTDSPTPTVVPNDDGSEDSVSDPAVPDTTSDQQAVSTPLPQVEDAPTPVATVFDGGSVALLDVAGSVWVYDPLGEPLRTRAWNASEQFPAATAIAALDGGSVALLDVAGSVWVYDPLGEPLRTRAWNASEQFTAVTAIAALDGGVR